MSIFAPSPPHIAKLRVVGPLASQTPWPCGFYNFGKQKVSDVDFFNCSIVERPDGVWLITRRSKAHPQMKIGFNDIACFLLEKNIPVRVHKANIKSMFPTLEHFEDPRAFYHNGLTYISCCNFVMKNRGWTGAHQMIAAMDQSWHTVKRWDPVYGSNGSELGRNEGNEKNWVWFHHDGNPHLIYLMRPHRVVRMSSDFVAEETFETDDELPWEYGEPRGGTPPILIGNEYWSFFHSSTAWRDTAPIRQYHMGAYCFESQPPFRITKMTPEPILSGSPYDRYSPDKPLVVFPNGALCKDGNFLVTMGVNDLDSAWIYIPMSGLKERMAGV